MTISKSHFRTPNGSPRTHPRPAQNVDCALKSGRENTERLRELAARIAADVKEFNELLDGTQVSTESPSPVGAELISSFSWPIKLTSVRPVRCVVALLSARVRMSHC